MVKIFLIILAVCLVYSYALADETITLATFYPSPYGVYNELRLFPRTTPPSTCNAGNYGAMYYNSTSQSLQVCGSTGWTNPPSSPPAGVMFFRNGNDYCGGTAVVCFGSRTADPVAWTYLNGAGLRVRWNINFWYGGFYDSIWGWQDYSCNYGVLCTQ
ncbi:MAG: hypothetical protein V1490_03765 [Candidatus Omnitrophota bacterium]|nr:hypothetical protein [Candidatus Omnitrophota bacterium]